MTVSIYHSRYISLQCSYSGGSMSVRDEWNLKLCVYCEYSNQHVRLRNLLTLPPSGSHPVRLNVLYIHRFICEKENVYQTIA